MACGALKALNPLHSELKSMRTAARHLRQGAASAQLTELLAIARQRGQERVSGVTGSGPAFEPAWALYRRYCFVACGPFANYPADPFTRFMTLKLRET